MAHGQARSQRGVGAPLRNNLSPENGKNYDRLNGFIHIADLYQSFYSYSAFQYDFT